MADQLVEIANGFWNVRGEFRVAGLLDVGTQTSLVRLKHGGFVLLDGYTLSGAVKQQVLNLTDGGRAVQAVVHLHPFHTVHVSRCAQQFPSAKQYGTQRHVDREPGLQWEPLRTDDPRLHEVFGDEFAFSVPQGVDFIPSNDALHFSSVLAIHRPSRVLHVDDTLSWLALPLLGERLVFHPTLRFQLQKRPGAVAEFRAWAKGLAEQCADVDHLCTAHAKVLPPQPLSNPPLAARVLEALDSVESMLARHEKRFG